MLNKYQKQAMINRLKIAELTENYLKEIEIIKNETIKSMKENKILLNDYDNLDEIIEFLECSWDDTNTFIYKETLKELKIIKFFSDNWDNSPILENIKNRKFLIEDIKFNEREFEILKLVCIGKTTSEINKILCLVNVNQLISRMGEKLQQYLEKKNKLEYLIDNGYIEMIEKDNDYKISKVKNTLFNLFNSQILAEL